MELMTDRWRMDGDDDGSMEDDVDDEGWMECDGA